MFAPLAYTKTFAMAAAAAITIFLLIGGSLSINLFTSTPSDQSLYSEYFNPETTLLTVRSGVTTSAAIEKGIILFNQEQYESAIVAFHSEPGNFTGKLYTGFSYMKLEQFDKAEMQFLAIIQNNDNLFVDQAEWNLGLCYLASGKEPQAKQVISKIAESNTAYSGKAEKLLLEMGKNN